MDLRAFTIELAFQPSSSATTPFQGYSYLDPTSFWREDAEEVVPADGLRRTRQKRRRTVVACTVRSAPDYLSFNHLHHQTVLFEAKSSLLEHLFSTYEEEI